MDKSDSRFLSRAPVLVLSLLALSTWCEAQRQWPGEVSFQLSQIGATQSQQTYGGLFSLANQPQKKHYCDSSSWAANLDLAGSHSVTSQANTPSIALDSDDGSLTLMKWVGPRTSVGGSVEMFLNNSLGVGLEQVYAVRGEHVVHCQEPGRQKWWQFFSVFGDGRYARQRLYKTPSEIDLAGVSAGERYVVRRTKFDASGKKARTLFRINQTAQVVPMVNDITAIQVYADIKLSLPLAIENLTFNVEEQEHYFGNAPHGFDKHYQQTSVSISYSFGSQ